MSKKEYKSYGAALKVGDFENLLEDLSGMSVEDKKSFFTPKNGEVFSEGTQLLYFLPDYCLKIKEEDGVKIKTGELLPNTIELLNFLLENGAEPEARMHNGVKAFLKSCETNSVELVRGFVENKYIKINIHTADGMTNDALHYAVMSESENIIEYLVKELGFDIDNQNFIHKNATALHFACGHGKQKSIEKLLELGANPLLEDFNECRPCDLMVLAYDEDEIEDYYGDSPDEEDMQEMEKWKNLYSKVLSATKNYKKVEKAVGKTTRRTSF